MLMPYLHNFNLKEWIEREKQDWGARAVRLIWESSDYVVLVGRGPSKGKDFHVGPSDEIFYQVEGEMNFNYMTADGERQIILLRPGETFLLPAGIPHAPRRPDENCLTLVVERRRTPAETDFWIWFCERCNNKLYETAPRIGLGPTNNTITQEANKLLRTDERLRTCSKCGDVLPPPGV
jgi:3-hydroxyanthranilate 3,4-dioxygenase